MPKKLNATNSLLLMIDIQEKLVNMLNSDTIAKKASVLMQMANHLDIPTIITEQYPKGLGNTINIVKSNISTDTRIIEKTCFSAVQQEEFENIINSYDKKQILLCGIEMHICVLQTALDLIDKGFEVFIVKDACGSRNNDELELAIERLKQENAVIISVEMAVFELLGNSKHPKFKELQAFVK